MTQRDGFIGGFLAGAIFGGIVGGVLGTVLAKKKDQPETGDASLLEDIPQPKISTEESIEDARRSLEDKIAQLNLAIDDVRQQLGSVNGNSPEN
ncbi:MAG: hypothetical protein ACFBSE_16330 [Prochloraceae cyanobacterium]